MYSISSVFAQSTISAKSSLFSNNNEGIQSFSQFKAKNDDRQKKSEALISDVLNPQDKVNISAEGLNQAEKTNQAANSARTEDSLMGKALDALYTNTTKTFASGTQVTISANADAEGFYTATINYADSRTSEKIQLQEDTVFSEDSAGNLIINTVEDKKIDPDDENSALVKEKNILGSKSDDLIVSISDNTKISSSDGNDTVVIFGENTKANLGDGDNQVVSRASSLSLNAGNGNNLISLAGMSNTLNVGDGNNTFYAYGDLNLKGGDGNNEINSVFGNIELGDGNNIVKNIANKTNTHYFENIKLGNGDNKLESDLVKNISTGSGNSIIDVDYANELQLGNGNNKVNIEQIARLDAGNGDNTINIDVLTKSLDAGDGDNEIIVNASYNKEAFLAYKELEKYENINDPNFKVSSASISIGNGNNNLVVKDTVHDIISRDSEDEEHVRLGYGSVHLGNGNNSINLSSIGSSEQREGLSLGNGNNNLTLENASEKASILAGDGINSIHLLEGQDNLKITAGSGHTSLHSEEGMKNLNFMSEGSAALNIEGNLEDSSVEIGENLNEDNAIDPATEGEIVSQFIVEGDVINSDIVTKGKAEVEILGSLIGSNLIAENTEKESPLDNIVDIKGSIIASEIEDFVFKNEFTQ